VTDVLPASQASAARMCSSCPKMCRSACPTQAVTRNERHQPWGHASQIVAAMGEEGGFADAELIDGVYACATCAACTVPCHVDGVETPDLVWAARAAVHRIGATPAAGLDAVDNARAGRVPAEVGHYTDPAPVLAALRGLATQGADLLLIPGCSALGRRPDAALAAGRALQALGIAFDVPSTHQCCGMPALTFGDEESAADMLAALQNTVAQHPSTRVTVQSPSCAWMLGVRAGATGVEPLAATLARALAGRVAPAAATPATYHDPCYLARHQRVRDEPRDALRAAGYAVAELPRHGDTTQCSGQGGGLPLTHPDIAAGYLALLIRQAESAGGERLVTGCPACAAALDGAGVPAMELAEAIAAALQSQEDDTR